MNGVELSGNKSLEDLHIKQNYTANDIHFTDGMTFQEKYDNGELKGDDYVLTDEDKNNIAELAVSKIEYGDERRY